MNSTVAQAQLAAFRYLARVTAQPVRLFVPDDGPADNEYAWVTAGTVDIRGARKNRGTVR